MLIRASTSHLKKKVLTNHRTLFLLLAKSLPQRIVVPPLSLPQLLLNMHMGNQSSTAGLYSLPSWVHVHYLYSSMTTLWVWNPESVGTLTVCRPLRESESETEVAQSFLTLCDPMDCSLSGSSVHGILQARILEWVAISFSHSGTEAQEALTKISQNNDLAMCTEQCRRRAGRCQPDQLSG